MRACSLLDSDEDIPVAAPAPLEAATSSSRPDLNPQQLMSLLDESSTDSKHELNVQNLYVTSLSSRGNGPAFPTSTTSTELKA